MEGIISGVKVCKASMLRNVITSQKMSRSVKQENSEINHKTNRNLVHNKYISSNYRRKNGLFNK